RAAHPLLDAFADGEAGYYVHSYAPVEVPPAEVVATTTHGLEFVAAAARGRVAGVQFHPERSGEAGVALLRRFVTMDERAASQPARASAHAPVGARSAETKPSSSERATPRVLAA